jgi:hypothetical protein
VNKRHADAFVSQAGEKDQRPLSSMGCPHCGPAGSVGAHGPAEYYDGGRYSYRYECVECGGSFRITWTPRAVRFSPGLSE